MIYTLNALMFRGLMAKDHEERELVEGGRVLRCVFTHSRVGEPKVTVVRWYVRG